ncbi:MAG TPA: radical SAM protein, partial [Thermoleophilia bacterium]|nr:radical SAM protein [Thermoleophilia bacterium]
THKAVRRRCWVEPSDVVAQVRAKLESEPDVIALAGSGEPTLHAGLGDVIGGIKRLTDVPVVVITNGSLLSRPTVCRGLAAADIVLPSLDAPDEGLFQLINRPHKALRFEDVLAGMIAFRNGYRGLLWLEVMLLAGVTGVVAEVERLAELAARIAPDRIQLNTAVRPPAESFAGPVADSVLQEFAGLFTPHAEVIAGTAPVGGDRVAAHADILALLSRRPCTVADIAAGLGIHHGEALKAVTALVTEGAAKLYPHADRMFYAAATAVAQNRQEEDP